ncbi:MAG: hypothetical protein JST92_00265 [Deltaproteobacteria bacterium]|nr:hypothetical protein [Deltaproteobacteria bacterium]
MRSGCQLGLGFSACVLLVCAGTLRCGGKSVFEADAGVSDSGADGATGDAGTDAGTDAGADAGSDGGAGGTGDASSDAGLDAGSADAGDGGVLDTCEPNQTPILFLHGNGESASVWSQAATDGGPSVLDSLRSAGWNECSLHPITWLTPAQQAAPQSNVHTAALADQVFAELDSLRRRTNSLKVNIVAHSMGVTVALHALEATGRSLDVGTFIGIAGGLRGLQSCLAVGYANALYQTCWAQSALDSNTFGFYPSLNPRMEGSGFRTYAAKFQTIDFATISAGAHDEILCPGCDSALFASASNVRAQLDVGAGTPTVVSTTSGLDDSTGTGHFRARRDSGPLLVKLLTTTCTGNDCCTGTGVHCN